MKNWKSYILFLIIGFLGLFTAGYLYQVTKAQALTQTKLKFELETHYFVDAIQNRYSKYQLILKGINSFFAASDFIDFTEWKTYFESLNPSEEFPSLRFLCVVQQIPQSDKVAVIEKLQAGGLADFKIWPESNSPLLSPAIYVYPIQLMNWNGYDFSQNPEFYPILQAAIAEKTPLIGPSFPPAKIGPKRSEITLWLTIDKPSKNKDSSSLFGWAMTLVDLNTMIDNAAKQVDLNHINIQMFDGEKSDLEHLILARMANPDPYPLFKMEQLVQFGPKNWTLLFSTGPQYKLNLDFIYPKILATAVSLATLFFLGLLHSFLKETRTLSVTAAENEEKFKAAAKIYHAVFDSTDYSIICTDQKGVILLFNKAAEKMLGYKAEEIIGKQTPEVFHDPEEMKARAKELSDLFGKDIPPKFAVFVALAEKGIPDERAWSYIRKDKSVVAVTLRVVKVKDENEVPIGYVGIAQYKK